MSMTPTVFYKLQPEEEVILQPGMQVRLATLTFLCERYNTGVASQKGFRPRMEDAYSVQQDIGID